VDDAWQEAMMRGPLGRRLIRQRR